MDVSIVIPTCNGGELLQRTLRAVFSQHTDKSYEVILIDSGSSPEQIKKIEEYPVKLFSISRSEFNHGLTRDLGASKSKGDFLIFINQDAEPANDQWLDLMVQPIIDSENVAAAQGRISERKGSDRYFWGSCGRRFYFTSESGRWIKRYHGIGFSTVNCAIRRSVWEKNPFGKMDIMEDKNFQRQVHIKGNEIVYADGCVYHSHNYTYYQLKKRCQDEGYGWRLVGENYSLARAFRDYFVVRNYLLLIFGLATFRIRKLSELAYPFMRPCWVYKGNHFNKSLLS